LADYAQKSDHYTSYHYSSGQERVPVPFRYYECTKLVTVSVSSSFRFYAP